MAGRGKKTVSVPQIRAFAHQSLPIPDNDNGPTLERLVQAGVPLATRIRTRKTEIAGTGADSPFGLGDGIARISQAPLDRLRSRGQLAPLLPPAQPDPDRNGKLFAAGDRFRQHCYRAGLSGIGSIDLNRSGGGGGDPAWLVPSSEAAAYHRDRVRRAYEAVGGRDLWRVVYGVCFEERDLVELGRSLGHGNDAGAAGAALALLRCGLEALAVLFGILPPQPVNDNAAIALALAG